MMDDRLTVCICGGGNGAHVLAGLTATHAQTEARVLTLFEKEAADWTASMKDNDFIFTRKNKDGGLVRLKAKPAFVTNDPSKAVLGADVIILCVPAFAHEQYFEAISPFVKRDAAIIGLPGQPGFEFQCFDILKDRARTCAVLNYESLPWACRIAEFGKRVDILGIKDALIGSKVVGRSHLNFDPVTLLQSVLGARPVLELANNYLEIYLMTKGFAHPPLMYAKWKDWDGEPLKERPLFYQSVLSFGGVCWGGNVTQQDANRPDKLIRRASGIAGRRLQDSSQDKTYRQTDKRQELESRQIERSGRVRAPAVATRCYK